MNGMEEFDILVSRWRTGRKVGRTIYAMTAEDPMDSDILIGVMDTRLIAANAVAAHNAVLDVHIKHHT